MSHNGSDQPYFFLSYVHDNNGDDELAGRFYLDLCRDVRLYSGKRYTDEVGFCDTTLATGNRWSPVLVEALCTARVFLALCSRPYFTSDACGKEWAIFERRLGSNSARDAAPLIPLFWVPMTPIDPVAQPYQWRDPTFSREYETLGIRDLMRLQKNHNDAYLVFVTALAKRIITLAQADPGLPAYPHRPSFYEVSARFPALAAPAVVGGAGQPVSRVPPRYQRESQNDIGTLPRLSLSDPPRPREATDAVPPDGHDSDAEGDEPR